jgi:hypothetical protein
MTRPAQDVRQRLADDLKRRLDGSASGELAQSRPIAFKVDLVRAIVQGTKTQTRRPSVGPHARLYEPGQRLWVREKWGRLDGVFVHAAEGELAGVRYFGGQSMPRAAARLTLEVLACRVEPLHAISGRDALAEGAAATLTPAEARAWFESTWREIYPSGESQWEANPPVVVMEFRLVDRV